MTTIITGLTRFVGSKRFVSGFFAIALVTMIFVAYYSVAPANFPDEKTVVTLEEGSTLSEAANTFAEEGIIKSPFFYKVFVVLLGGQRKVIAGDYLFEKPETALRVAFRTVNGMQGIRQIKITLPEGIASYDIARLLDKAMPNFDAKSFLALAKPHEGYLFPDTYYFYETMTPQQIVDMMLANFEKKIKNVSLSISQSGRSIDEVLTMASLVEKEASIPEDRRIISGILWKRMDNKHLLQVDAPFFYTLGKDSSKLTLTDLASDSPYNLYKHMGLPPTPINNPGIEAIEDTLNSKETKFWFYLSDSKGVTHYAETYEGHLANKEKYID
jgi:UPF0755 protein